MLKKAVEINVQPPARELWLPQNSYLSVFQRIKTIPFTVDISPTCWVAIHAWPYFRSVLITAVFYGYDELTVHDCRFDELKQLNDRIKPIKVQVQWEAFFSGVLDLEEKICAVQEPKVQKKKKSCVSDQWITCFSELLSTKFFDSIRKKMQETELRYFLKSVKCVYTNTEMP